MAKTKKRGSLLRRALIERGNVLAVECPSRGVLEHVTSRWGTLVLVSLRDGTLRFSELRRQVTGVSEKMLAQTLRSLEQDGFVARQVHPVIPPHVDYALTPLGQELASQLVRLTNWIEVNLGRVLTARGQQKRAGTPASGG